MDDERWMNWPKNPRGIKRPPEDSLDSEQRLAKRLSLLDLEHNGDLHSHSPAQPSSDDKRASTTNDIMQLDDTKHKIYIYNLEAELAECDSPEEKLIFLPDIEKRMTGIPQSILRSPQQTAPSTNTEVVLYKVPSSLSIPKEQDSVRKAIIESRARRQAQMRRNGVATLPPLINGNTGGSNSEFGSIVEDTTADGFGTKLSNAPASWNPVFSQPLLPNTNTRGSIFALPSRNPLANGYPDIHVDTAPHTTGATSANLPISFPPPIQPPLINEYSTKPFSNSFSTKPVNIQEIVVLKDPDAMEIG